MKRLKIFIFPVAFILLIIAFIFFLGPTSRQERWTWASSVVKSLSLGKLFTYDSTPDFILYNKNKGAGNSKEAFWQYAEREKVIHNDYIWHLPLVTQFPSEVIVPWRLGRNNLATQKPLQPDKKITEVPVIIKEITDPKSLSLAFKIHEQALTVIKNKDQFIPLRDLEDVSFASLAIGQPKGNYFQEYLDKYASFTHFSIADKGTSSREYDVLVNKLAGFKVVTISLHNLNDSPFQAYGIPQATRTFIERLRTKTNVVLVVFGTPYSLKYFDQLDYLVCAYEDNSVTQKLVPQLLFGAIPASGKLPVTVTETLKEGTGLTTASLKRLGYTVPERVGLSSATLQRIDRIVEGCILDSVMPGAQVLVAKNGKVVYEKAYGYLTYDKGTPVTTRTLFDLASVTKVAATLQAVMSLYDQGKLDINRKASDYLPELKNTNKEDIIIRDLLLHQAGLLSFQDHWTKTKRATDFDTSFYSLELNEKHPIIVAPGLYGIATLKDSLWQWTIHSRLLKKTTPKKKYTYKYSDVGFDILQQIVERLVKAPLDGYLRQAFYQPLGLDELTFNPLNKFDESRIAPTEHDLYFRGRLIKGTVHDQEAALMGGVAGHAGLFGTANDLAILMQMNLQKGYYGGKQFYGKNTLATFTKTYTSDNHRGLGWDRPLPKGGGYVSDLASRNSFGHLGFTGTCVWVDPDEDIVYIFLSNRVYPTVENNKLARYKVRQKIQNVIYESISTDGTFVAELKDEKK